jgi:superfamily II DNA/RNA helicase
VCVILSQTNDTIFVVVLVLDEADRLLDMGFRDSLTKIMAQLPGVERRQTMLFRYNDIFFCWRLKQSQKVLLGSATFPKDVQALTRLALKPKHKSIDVVGAQSNATGSVVDQSYLIV